MRTIHQAPDRLQNPRETKAFALENRAGKWSITTVQIGNNFAHTGRSGAAIFLLMFSIGCGTNLACASTDLTANRDLDSQIGCKSP